MSGLMGEDLGRRRVGSPRAARRRDARGRSEGDATRMTGRTGQRGGRAGQQRDLATRAHGARDEVMTFVRVGSVGWLVICERRWMILLSRQESQRDRWRCPPQPGASACARTWSATRARAAPRRRSSASGRSARPRHRAAAARRTAAPHRPAGSRTRTSPRASPSPPPRLGRARGTSSRRSRRDVPPPGPRPVDASPKMRRPRRESNPGRRNEPDAPRSPCPIPSLAST